MTLLEDILPESLVPPSHKAEYDTIKKIIANVDTMGSGEANKRIKEAMIADMADILNAVDWNKIKNDRLQRFKAMVSNMQEAKKSTSYKSSASSNYSTSREGGSSMSHNRSRE